MVDTYMNCLLTIIQTLKSRHRVVIGCGQMTFLFQSK